MDNQRLPRLLELITILQSGVGTQLYVIMDELNISRSTAFRDLKVLRDAGIPYTFDAGQGYHVSATYYLPSVNLQTSEAHALVSLIKCAASHVDGQISADAIRALRKITCRLSVPVKEVCRGLLQQVTVISSTSEHADTQTDNVSTFLDAIDRNLCLSCAYRSSDGKVHQLRLHPYHLINAECQWMLVARIHPGNVMRTLPLAALSQLRLTDTTFRRQNFEIQTYLGKAWRWCPEGHVYALALRIDASIASSFTSIQWHSSQSYRMLSDGACEMTFEVDGLSEIADWIWRHHDAMTVLKPAKLKQIIAARCKKMLSKMHVPEA